MKGKTELNKKGLFFLAIFIILGIVSFLLLRPFIISIFIAMIITYMFYPLYRFFLSKIKNKNLSALIVTALIALIIFVPLSIFFNSLISQIYNSYLSIQSLISGSAFSLENCSINPLVCRLVSIADNALKVEIFRNAWNEMILSTANVVIKATSSFLISIPSKLFDLFLIFFTIFFLLRDYDYFSAGINSIIPLHESHRKKILKQFNDSLYAVIYGNILIALVQGVFATVGFYFLKVPSFALWGLLTTIAAMIPFIGPPAIWLPLSIVQMLRGYLSHESSILWNGIFI
ncbi:MAG: AI-2E family transporter, partial [Candidatus Woesearchaeota archaeon]|nr:AI-2E family transporter [Candidatus Woesearchaeota archaeon]